MEDANRMTPRHDTAARHMREDAPRALPTESAGEVLARLRTAGPAATAALYVVDAEGKLQGRLPWAELLRAPAEGRVGDLAGEASIVCQPGLDQERAATRAVRHHLEELPVVDKQGRLLGVIPALALIQILRHEHVEDLHRLAGIRRETRLARSAVEAPPARRAWDRLPWLLVGLVGSMAATWVMRGFEHTLESQIAVSFFIPGLVYLADAIGTQAEAVAVRGLSLSNKPLRVLLLEELGSGLFIGLALAALVCPAIWLFMGDLRLAVAVSAALLAAGTLASTIGLFLPWSLWRGGIDPAFGSGPLATIIQDVLSLLVYLGVVRAVIGA